MSQSRSLLKANTVSYTSMPKLQLLMMSKGSTSYKLLTSIVQFYAVLQLVRATTKGPPTV
jgi:hypothetical protein